MSGSGHSPVDVAECDLGLESGSVSSRNRKFGL